MDAILPGLKIAQAHGNPYRLNNLSKRVGRPGASAMRGDGEQRTEPYGQYGEGVAEPSTKQRAASWVILPLFHPAAAMYNGGLRQTLLDDFMKIPSIIQEIQDSNNS